LRGGAKGPTFRKTAIPVANSAASWRGLPSAEYCEVASDLNGEGQETVTARALVHANVQQVWRVLTDFEKLVDVVPNLIECEEIPTSNPKSRRLRQSAGLKCSWWKLQAHALLEIQFKENSPRSKELKFRMIEGDFREYHGRFLVEADPSGLASVLVFDAVIEPLESIPQMLFTHAVQIWLPFNLGGIVRKAEQIAMKEARISPFAEPSIDSEVSFGRDLSGISKQNKQRFVKRRVNPAVYLGTAFVPLPSSAPEFQDVSVKETTRPPFELDTTELDGVDVHLRKLDTAEFLHRRVVCSMHIGASVKSVWNVLTDYERLADFIPSLVCSEVIPHPPGAPPGYHRIRQVVRKIQTYVRLEAESVMDVVERPYKEIQFRQVKGFVQKLQGKWILKHVNNDWKEEDMHLTYALEIKTPHTDTHLDLVEPIFEQAVVEGLPLGLTAIKQQVIRLRDRPSLVRLSTDFEVLRSELMSSYMQNGKVLPSRMQLREDRRTDLEKAISAHGGPSEVSERMGWKLPGKRRKRRGYWEDFENLKQELLDFVAAGGWELSERIPSKSDFNQAGRVDLRRAVEKWGGINAVMELIALDTDPVEMDFDRALRSRKMDINIRDVDMA